MSTRYLPLLEAIKTALATIAPSRIVTRNYDDFANRLRDQLLGGIYTVQPGPIGPYPYEVSDNGGATDSLRATEFGRMSVTIIGQQELDPDCLGTDIDAAEFAMLHELEQLADAAMEIDELMALKLNRAVTSQQAEKPYAWIHTEWEVFPLA